MNGYHSVMANWVPDGPLETGSPYWFWIGGRPALDLVNTRVERWRRNIECLAGPDDVVDWMVAARLLPERMPTSPALLAQARGLREAIDAGVRAAVADSPADPVAVGLIDRWLVHAAPRPVLVTDADGAPLLAEQELAGSPRRALALIALDAARMRGTAGERARVRICDSDTCSARFFDRSSGARRRWCTMQGCGNAEKARRHRARAARLATTPANLEVA
jgi:predicted RNA-binding Zn ribbon-like protein